MSTAGYHEALRRVVLQSEAMESYLIVYEGVQIDRTEMVEAFRMLAEIAKRGLEALQAFSEEVPA